MNLKLVKTNDDLSKDLANQKARNKRLVTKLQNAAKTLQAQQKAVQQMVSASAKKVAVQAAEEADDAQDAVVNEEAESGTLVGVEDDAAVAPVSPAPVALPAAKLQEDEQEEEEEGSEANSEASEASETEME